MERKITITYHMFNDEGESPKEGHISEVENDAMSRIMQKLEEGYTSGELHTNIRMLDDDPEEGITYSGWFDIKKETIANV